MGKLMMASSAAAEADKVMFDEALEIVEKEDGIADIISRHAKTGDTSVAINKSYFNYPTHLPYILRVLSVYGYQWKISEKDPDDYIINWLMLPEVYEEDEDYEEE